MKFERYPTVHQVLFSALSRVLAGASEETQNSAFVILQKKSKVLIGKRAGGGWTFPGGRFDAGENASDAAKRELAEESGIQVSVEELYPIDSRNVGSRKVHVFKAEPGDQEPEVTNKKEIKKWKWVKAKNLSDYIDEDDEKEQFILECIGESKQAEAAGQNPDHEKSGNELGITDDKKPKFSPEFSQKEFAKYVKEKSDHIPETGFAVGDPKDFEWSFVPDFELAKVTPIKEDWIKWYDGEWTEWVHDHGTEERAGHFERWADAPEKKPPIVIVGTDGKLHIWDGHHRIGIAHKQNMPQIPVLYGVPKK